MPPLDQPPSHGRADASPADHADGLKHEIFIVRQRRFATRELSGVARGVVQDRVGNACWLRRLRHRAISGAPDALGGKVCRVRTAMTLLLRASKLPRAPE